MATQLHKDLSIADLVQHVTLKELQEFTKENQLKSSDNKKELAQTIHAFFASKAKKDQQKQAQLKKDEIKAKRVAKRTNKKTKEEIKTFIFDPHLIELLFHWGYFSSEDVLFMYGVCKSNQIILKPILEQHFVFRIPKHERITTLAPRRVIVSVGSRIPSCVTHLEFDNDYIQNIEYNKLPLHLTHMKFSRYFNYPVLPSFPASVTHITFGQTFDKAVNDLPRGLTNLDFSGAPFFNQAVDKLPQSLTHLTLGKNFNQVVDFLPPKLTHLTFGIEFTQSVDCLPSSLTHLIFGDKFNSPVAHLPHSLMHLKFGECFNHSIDDLPPSLLHLTLVKNSKFDFPISNFPPSLQLLKFGKQFNQPLIAVLPASLKLLAVGAKFNQLDKDGLPKKLVLKILE